MRPPLYFWALCGLVLAFSVWCVLLLASVSQLRSALESRVGWIHEIQLISSGLDRLAQRSDGWDAEARQAWQEVGERTARLRDEVRLETSEDSRRGPRRLALYTADAVPDGNVAARVEDLRRAWLALDRALNDGLVTPERFPARRAYLATPLDQALTLVRADNTAISRKLARQWDSISFLVIIALMLAASTLALTVAYHRRSRLAELQKEELAEAYRHVSAALLEGEAANRARAAFLANISHELRTPLHAILGATDLIQVGPHDAELRDYRQIVRQSGASLLDRVNALIELSSLEAGDISLTERMVSLTDLVDRAVAGVAGAVEQRGLELECVIPPDVPAVMGDGDRIRQVMEILLANAVKFTDQGSVRVTLRLIEVNSRDVSFRCEVYDTGGGIAPEVRSRLFAPFGQLDTSTRRRYGGTGVGLALARLLIQRMGGDIGLESEPGWSRFWFELRLKRAAAPVAEGAGRLDWTRVTVGTDGEVAFASETTLDQDRRGDATAETTLDQDRRDETSVSELLDHTRRDETSVSELLDHTRRDETSMSDVTLDPVQRVEPDTVGFGAEARHGSRAALDGRFKALDFSDVGPRRRILVVDDDRINQMVAQRMLERLAYRADIASDGVEALEALELARYDAILMDCHMPRMDGYEATREIRRREGTDRRIPIIAMTANALQDIEERCRKAGMDAYLAKPCTLDEMERVLRQHLEEEVQPAAP